MHSSQSRTAEIVASAAEHAVVEPVVAVDDRGRALLGDLARERVVGLVHRGQVESAGYLGVGPLELAVPALQLALDVRLLLAEVAEPDRVDVDGVDRGEHVDDRLARDATFLDREGLGLRCTTDHAAVHEVHHVERGSVDRPHRCTGRWSAGPGRRWARAPR